MTNFLFIGNADTGGQDQAISKAINKYTNHNSRAVKMNMRYFQFPYDLCRDNGGYDMEGNWVGRDGILDIIAKTDIICFDVVDRYFGWDIMFEEHYEGKRIVYRQNGSQVRDYPLLLSGFFRKHNDAVIVSTGNLLDHLGGVEKVKFIPNIPVDEDRLNEIPKPEWQQPVSVVHSPGRPKVKGTFPFIKALGKVSENCDLNFIPLSRMPWQEVLEERSKYNFLFDQMRSEVKWYGNVSVEACWVGQPVITNKILRGKTEVIPPFSELKNLDTIYHDLSDLFKNLTEEKYKKMQNDSMEWARSFHSPERVAPIHAKWMIENAIEWDKDHEYLTDVILMMHGKKWVRGQGKKI